MNHPPFTFTVLDTGYVEVYFDARDRFGPPGRTLQPEPGPYRRYAAAIRASTPAAVGDALVTLLRCARMSAQALESEEFNRNCAEHGVDDPFACKPNPESRGDSR